MLLSLTRKHLASAPGTTSAINNESSSTPSYASILYAWRIRNNNFRGAAEILYERLQRLKHSPAASSPDDESLLDCYLTLINTLACCGTDEAWILAERIEGLPNHSHSHQNNKSKTGRGGKAVDGGDNVKAPPRRKIVTLEDMRREYSNELDRRSEILQGRFALVGNGDDDDDDDDGGERMVDVL